MRSRILPTLAPNATGSYSYVLIKGKDVIGVSVQYELLSILQMPSIPCDLELFVKLGEAGKRLEQSINVTEMKRG